MAARKAGIDLHFSDEERRVLKELARGSIERVLFGREEEPPEVPGVLKKKMGAFVCLKTKGELKGCIGYIRGQMPLDETVRRMAVEAAFHDPRFAPLERRRMGEYGHRDFGPHPDEEDKGHRRDRGGCSRALYREGDRRGTAPAPGCDGERVGQEELPRIYV